MPSELYNKKIVHPGRTRPPVGTAACAGPAGQREARWSGELPECLYGHGGAPYGAIPRWEPMLDKGPGRHTILGDVSFTQGCVGCSDSLSRHAAEECQDTLTAGGATLPASTRQRPSAAGPLPTG